VVKAGRGRWSRLAVLAQVAVLGGLGLCAPAGLAEAAASDPAAGEGAGQATTAFELVGTARLRVMLWSIYDSRLYTESGSYRRKERPLRLEIEYLRNISADRLIDRTAKEWAAMGRNHPAQDRWLARLKDLWPDIRKGDVLAIELNAQNVATFYHNGRQLGAIQDADFGQQFVDIWLSEDTTRPEMRQALLGDSAAN